MFTMQDLILKDTKDILEIEEKLGQTPKKVSFNKEIVISQSEAQVRSALESRKTQILVDPHNNLEKDYMHSRRSGLDQVCCKLAKKNKISIVISYSSIKNSKDRPLTLGKIAQNLRLCKKYKVPIILASFASKKEEVIDLNNFKSLIKSLE